MRSHWEHVDWFLCRSLLVAKEPLFTVVRPIGLIAQVASRRFADLGAE